jgi:hypothetical protein
VSAVIRPAPAAPRAGRGPSYKTRRVGLVGARVSGGLRFTAAPYVVAPRITGGTSAPSYTIYFRLNRLLPRYHAKPASGIKAIVTVAAPWGRLRNGGKTANRSSTNSG